MDTFADRFHMLTLQMVPFVMAVVFHEYAHGFMASRYGDKTAKDAGRLTLNPIPHMDPIGTVLFPVINMLSGMNILFGWARPVPINPASFSRPRAGLFWTAFAGPGMNFILAIFSAALFCAIRLWVSRDFYLYDPLLAMTYISVSLNYALGIFNLIPLPPLDGSKMVESFLPFKWAIRYEGLAKFSMILLIVLLFSGMLSYLMIPIRFCADLTLFLMAQFFQLPLS